MAPKLKLLIFLALFTIFFSMLILFYYGYVFKKELQHNQTVYIPAGYSTTRIASHLENNNLIVSQKIFIVLAYFYRFISSLSLKAGEYLLPSQASIYDLIKLIASGKMYIRKITVIEGQTIQDIIKTLKTNPYLNGEIKSIPSEGLLLPDTYQYKYGDNRQEILDRMHHALMVFLEQQWSLRSEKQILKNPFEAIILASIVEKETGVNTERALIAGVFYNRLRMGMRLQSDPTVSYGITKGSSLLDRLLTRQDLKNDSPYNTYTRDGLPPTPIACPGKAAILAVLHPEATDKIYFVANGSGGHNFSITLAQHNENIKRWKDLKKGFN